MNTTYSLFHKGRRIGVLSVQYNIGLDRADCSAFATNDDGSVRTSNFYSRSYAYVLDEAVKDFSYSLKIAPSEVERFEAPPYYVYQPEDRGGNTNWLQTRTGKRVWAYDTRIEDIHLAEIAHGLREGRFANQTLGLYTYSVLQHSVHASHLGDSCPHARMAKLLHDAHEAVLKDMPKPLRNHPGMADYNAACDARQRVINVWARLDPDAHHLYDVKAADAIMLATERRDLMAPNEHIWQKSTHEPAEGRIHVWEQPFAVYAFLVTFCDLAKKVCPIRYEEAAAVLEAHLEACRDEGLDFTTDDLSGMVNL